MNERDQMELLAMVSLRSSADGVALVQWVDDLLDHHVREAEARVLVKAAQMFAEAVQLHETTPGYSGNPLSSFYRHVQEVIEGWVAAPETFTLRAARVVRGGDE